MNLYSCTVSNTPSKSISVQLQVAGKWLNMEVDTGAAVSILSETALQKKFPRNKLKPSSMVLKTYTGEPMKVVGIFSAQVCTTRSKTHVTWNWLSWLNMNHEKLVGENLSGLPLYCIGVK